MDVFGVRDRLIDDYRKYTRSFVDIRDRRVREHVEERIVSGYQWPDPWLALNPNFAPGGSITDLIDGDLLHEDCAQIFRMGDSAGGRPLQLHRHQRAAVKAARDGHSYVLTTGTGSGKSLAYIIPIVDRILRAHATGTYLPGIKAIVIYPMNALANSQLGELGKFLSGTGSAPRISFERYTGQESAEDRRRIVASPPDILLTNYVMAELVLTRPKEAGLVAAARGLEFLVLDELHTYRGRQGADVALLVRRLREACDAQYAQCVGTSATMSTEGGPARQREVVAGVASQIFGLPVAPENVIGETLDRVTMPVPAGATALKSSIGRTPPADYDGFVRNPLAGWVEETLGFEPGDTDGPPVRRRHPLTLAEAAQQLSETAGSDEGECRQAIKQILEAGAQILNPATGRPVFAFRLHQFLSKGDNVYVTAELPDQRHVTSKYQVEAPSGEADAAEEDRRLLFPLAFCRECGQEYLVVHRQRDGEGGYFTARQDNDASGGDAVTGYLYMSDDNPWPLTETEVLEDARLPYTWLTAGPDGGQVVTADKEKYLPEPLAVTAAGRVAGTGAGTAAAYVPSPLRFCLRCLVSYEQARGSDFAKLAKLSAEGRSSAVSVVSASTVAALRQADDDVGARKLLAFVDNRQDASLQSGHFNDYVQVAQLRGALYRALAAEPGGLSHDVIPQRVSQALGLQLADFAQAPEATAGLREAAWRALREVTGFRLYLDLERGWRVTMPNLEQTGLLRIAYPDLAEVAGDEQRWSGCHTALRGDEPAHRRAIAAALLDELRRNLAIDVPYLSTEGFDPIKRISQQHLKEPWSLPEREQPPIAGAAFPGPSRPGRPRSDLYLSGRGSFGRFLRREYDQRGIRLNTADAQQVIEDLFGILDRAGLLVMVTGEAGVPGYRLRAAAIRWEPGDGTSGAEDPVRRTLDSQEGPRVNPFFRDLYSGAAAALAGLHAKEHTAQVPPAQREERERQFRDGDQLPILYCSPTMELGIDISDLSAVIMRNVPPTPANYAQRSGRAGRSGQPALVATYCATGNAHDQYYFRHPIDMVGGSVVAPRLDLANEDLIRSHVHAVWLAETGQDLHGSLPQLLDVSGDDPGLDILPKVTHLLDDPGAASRAADRVRMILAGLIPELKSSSWWTPRWIDEAARQAPQRFRDACRRWQDLYRAALREFHSQSKLSVDISVPAKARAAAQRRARDAYIQLGLLRNEDSEDFQTDFYSYRYFASEGFLPGYSFPRLPLAAYIPGLAGRRDGDFIQRPRFIGIREFGPGAVVYHEGARYQVISAQLSQPGGSQEGLPTSTARRCGGCGYLHDAAVGIDLCDNCGRDLGHTTRSLLRLTSVRTARRDRISSDEEERRRSWFELETSYRFADHGSRPGRVRATAATGERHVLELTYGDSATVRITNLGRGRRKNPSIQGYLIDTTSGRWLKESDGYGDVPDEADLQDADDVKRKERVIPYVEDRRNVLLIRLPARADTAVAVSVATALERGIEARFQLEDSELSSELLPDPDGRGRALFIESAEGGAGVLRRLVEEEGRLAEAAGTALALMHFDPETGEDRSREEDAREPCAAACYECLLSYANQTQHALISRHLARDVLLDLARAATTAETAAQSHPPTADNGPAGEFLGWLREAGYRLPDEVDTEAAPGARPHMIYRLRDGNVAVFLDSGQGPGRDRHAQEQLRDDGWSVVRRHDGEQWEALVARYPSVFGSHRGGLL